MRRWWELAAVRPRATLWAAAVATVLAIAGAGRLRVHAGLEAMFPRHDPAAVALAGILDRMASADELLVLVSAPAARAQPEKLVEYAGRFQTAAQRWGGAMVEGVIYRAPADAEKFIERELAPAAMFYLDDEQLAAARKRLSLAGMRQRLARDQVMMSEPGPAAEALGKAMMQDPLGLHEFLAGFLAGARPMRTYGGGDALISPDGTALLIRVLGNHPPTDLAYANALTNAMQRAADEAEPDGLSVQLAGAYPIAALSQRSIRRDAIEGVVGSVVLLLGVFIAAYRRPIGMFHLALMPVAVGTLWGFGAYGVVRGNVSPIAAVIGGVLAGMAIDYSVLYLNCYQTLRNEGAGAVEAARGTIGEIGGALVAAFVTSIAGFVAIGCSSVEALRDFAILGAMGLTGSFLAAVFVLPAVLVLSRWSGERGGRVFRFGMEPLLGWVRRQRVALLVAGAVIGVGALVVAGSGPGVMVMAADLSVMHPRPNPPLDAEEEIGRRFGVSAGTMLVDLHAGDEGELAALAHAVKRRLSTPEVKAAGVAGVYGLANWLADPAVVAERMKGESARDGEEVVEDFREAVAESAFDMKAFGGYAVFLRQLVDPASAPDIAALRKYPGLARDLLPAGDGDTEAVSVLFLSGNEESAADRDRAIEAVRGALADLPGAVLSGLPVVGYDADRAVRSELPRLLWIALGLVAGYLLIHFRNPRDMLLSLLPGLFGMAALAGVVRLAGVRLNMVNFVALPLLIGIDVDYGIYLVSLARRKGARPLGAGAHAVVVCATSMIAGYASLMPTSVPAVRSLGFIVSVGVVCCLAGTLFLLCAVLGGGEKG